MTWHSKRPFRGPALVTATSITVLSVGLEMVQCDPMDELNVIGIPESRGTATRIGKEKGFAASPYCTVEGPVVLFTVDQVTTMSRVESANN